MSRRGAREIGSALRGRSALASSLTGGCHDRAIKADSHVRLFLASARVAGPSEEEILSPRSDRRSAPSSVGPAGLRICAELLEV